MIPVYKSASLKSNHVQKHQLVNRHFYNA